MNLASKIRLCLAILMAKPGNLMAHAERELPPANGDEMQAWMNRHLLELVLVFSTHGHSGFSASYAIKALERLLRFEPLRPLTGEESEWIQVGPDVWQNSRCGRVFKDADGAAYDIEGRVFREPSGCCYTSKASRVAITFPYTPTTEVIDVPAPGAAACH